MAAMMAAILDFIHFHGRNEYENIVIFDCLAYFNDSALARKGSARH